MAKKSKKGEQIVAEGLKSQATQLRRKPKVKRPEKDENVLVVQAPQRRAIKLTLVGTTPMLTSRFTDEAAETIIESDKEGATATKPRKSKQPSPKEQYLASRYMLDEKTHGFPVGGLKRAMVEACRSTDLSMVHAKTLFHAMPSLIHDELYPLKYKRVEMKRHIIRTQSGSRRPVHRAMYTDWTMDVIVEWDESVLSQEEVVNLVLQAGTIGLGAFTPRCNGYYGQFTIAAGKGKAKKVA